MAPTRPAGKGKSAAHMGHAARKRHVSPRSLVAISHFTAPRSGFDCAGHKEASDQIDRQENLRLSEQTGVVLLFAKVSPFDALLNSTPNPQSTGISEGAYFAASTAHRLEHKAVLGQRPVPVV